MKKAVVILTLFVMVMMVLPAPSLAQEPATCDVEYTVQAGDWLSKVAEKYLGNPLAYAVIFAANNANANDNYTDIGNADLIEPGWLLCIPGGIDAAAQNAPEGLSPEELANATYISTFTQDGTAPLTNGEYSEEAAPGSATKTTVRITNNIAYGELNGQPSAAVVTVTDPGGSGTFYDLHVMVNQDGQPTDIATTSLGDRVEINSIAIENNQIVIDMVQAGPDDPLCCPSQRVIKTYELQGDQLVEVSSQVVEDGGDEMMSQGLAGTDWLLTSLNGEAVPAEVPVTAKFGEDGSLSGTSGCNNYSTSYTVDGSSLTINPLIAGTMMACPEPQMSIETAYMGMLGTVAGYEINGDELLLKDANGNVVATFTALKPVELAGSSWQVTSYNNGKGGVQSVIIGTELTANFGTDGSLAGSAGCNNYTTTYQTDGNNISIGPAATTRMFCAEPEGIMEQEQAYLAALETAATYEIELNRMDMYTAEGSRVAVFELMPQKEAPAPEGEATLSGTITTAQPAELPADAVIQVQLQDTSLADAPATIIGEQIIPAAGVTFPIPFEITYNPNDIQDNHTYTMSVRIEDASGKLLYINTTSTPVLTNGAPTDNVEVVVDPV